MLDRPIKVNLRHIRATTMLSNGLEWKVMLTMPPAIEVLTECMG